MPIWLQAGGWGLFAGADLIDEAEKSGGLTATVLSLLGGTGVGMPLGVTVIGFLVAFGIERA